MNRLPAAPFPLGRRAVPFMLLGALAMVAGWWFYMPTPGRFSDGPGEVFLTQFGLVIFATLVWFASRAVSRMEMRAAAGRLTGCAVAAGELSESDRRFRFLADTMPQIIWTAKPDGNLDYYNQRWFDYTGMTFEQTKDWGWKPVIHPDDLQNCIDRWSRAFTTGCDYEVEYRFRRASDGAYRWHLGRAFPMRDESGEIVQWVGTCTDIEDQRRAREELEKRVAERTAKLEDSANRLKLATRIAGTGVWEWDLATGQIVWDDQMFALYGIAPKEVTYSDWSSAVLAEDLPAQEAVLKETARIARRSERQFRIRRRSDGAVRYVHACEMSVVDESGKPVRIVGVNRDITEMRENEEAIRATQERAEAATRAKSEFLANMSHEIRTPMNGVIGMTGLLLDTPLDAAQRKYAEAIRFSGQSLLNVINDILDFSKIESGRLQFEQVDFNLASAVHETIQLLNESATAKQIELSVVIDPEVPTQLKGDPGRLRQVLTNLISNAIKFTSAGEVAVSITLAAEDETSATLRCQVADTGIGISDEAQAKLFQAFVQADGSSTRKYGGTGLGLVICKQIVELMNGQIGVESREGFGSKFWFTAALQKQVPRAEPEESNVTALTLCEFGAAVSPVGRRQGRLRVLVAEENSVNQRVIVDQLRKLGHLADFVGSGTEVVSALQQIAYDAVVMDCAMSEMDGFRAAAEIRRREGGSRHTWIIAMSADASGSDRARCIAAGADYYLGKPVTSADLGGALKRCCRTPIDDERLRLLSGSGAMPDALAESIDQLLHAGPDALRGIREAIDAADAAKLAAAAHSLRESCAHLGAARLEELCGDLMRAGDSGEIAAATQIANAARFEFSRVIEALQSERNAVTA